MNSFFSAQSAFLQRSQAIGLECLMATALGVVYVVCLQCSQAIGLECHVYNPETKRYEQNLQRSQAIGLECHLAGSR